MENKCMVALEAYCLEVGKHLVCKKSTKKRLLSALREELRDTTQGCNSYEELTAQVGAPLETAKNLQETVSDQEYAEVLMRARRKEKLALLRLPRRKSTGISRLLLDKSLKRATKFIITTAVKVCTLLKWAKRMQAKKAFALSHRISTAPVSI